MAHATPDNPMRKAALFVRSLDPESMAAVLARLSPSEGKALRAAVRELGEVDDHERERLAREVMESRRERPAGGAEVELKLSANAPSAGAVSAGHAAPAAVLTAAPAGSVARPPATPVADPGGVAGADPDTLAQCLANEQPRTVAVILSLLTPGRAADVLVRLPADTQTAALESYASLGEVDPEALAAISAEVEGWVNRRLREKQRLEGRMASIAAILSAAPDSERSALLLRLQRAGHGWADRLGPAPATQVASPPPSAPPAEAPPAAERTGAQPAPWTPPDRPAPPGDAAHLHPTTPPAGSPDAAAPAFAFAALERMKPAELGAALRASDSETVLVALLGASEALLKRIERLGTRRDKQNLRAKLRAVGPVRLSDIELAQRLVCENAALSMRRSHRVLKAA